MCLYSKSKDTKDFYTKNKAKGKVTVYKILRADDFTLQSIFRYYYWHPGVNYSDSIRAKTCFNTTLVNRGFHVYLKRPTLNDPRCYKRIIVPFTAYISDLIGVNYSHNEACFTKLTLSKKQYRKAIFGDYKLVRKSKNKRKKILRKGFNSDKKRKKS